MSDKQSFLQFPLAFLAYEATNQQNLHAALAYATILAGQGYEEKIGIEKSREIIEPRIAGWRGYHRSEAKHRWWAHGTPIIGLGWQDTPEHCTEIYRAFTAFLREFGKSPFVRIAGDLFREAYSGEFEFRDFAVLCAAYSVIGSKQYAIVRRNRIRAGALGYSGASALFDKDGNLTDVGQAALAKRKDGAQPMSVDQCRYVLKRLHGRKFFSRIQPFKNGRAVYYSRGMDHDKLADLLYKRLERKLADPVAQQTAQEKLREKTASLLKRVTCGENESNVTQLSPQSPQIVPAGLPASLPAGVPALILAPPIGAPLIDAPIIDARILGAHAPPSPNRSEGEKPPEPEDPRKWTDAFWSEVDGQPKEA